MKRMVRILSIIMSVVILATSMCGCMLFEKKTDEELIREKIEEFVYCCNSGDLKEAFDCFDKKSRNTYKAMFNIGSSILGMFTGFTVDVSDLFALAFGLTTDDLIQVEIHSIEIIDETNAVVMVTLACQDEMLQIDETAENIEIKMLKEKRDWYINARVDWQSIINEGAQYAY